MFPDTGLTILQLALFFALPVAGWAFLARRAAPVKEEMIRTVAKGIAALVVCVFGTIAIVFPHYVPVLIALGALVLLWRFLWLQRKLAPVAVPHRERRWPSRET